MAYRRGAGGFRVDELRSLTPESFRLDRDPSIFTSSEQHQEPQAGGSADPKSLARELREWIRDKPPGQSVFPLHHETAKAIGPTWRPSASRTRPTKASPTSIRCEPTTSRHWFAPVQASPKSAAGPARQARDHPQALRQGVAHDLAARSKRLPKLTADDRPHESKVAGRDRN